MIQKSFGKEHVDCVDQYNIHFAISHTKTEFSLCHSMPFFNDEIHKITFILNNLFKITSLDREGLNEYFIYWLDIIVELSQFMSTFEFFDDIDFNSKDGEVIFNLISSTCKKWMPFFMKGNFLNFFNQRTKTLKLSLAKF